MSTLCPCGRGIVGRLVSFLGISSLRPINPCLFVIVSALVWSGVATAQGGASSSGPLIYTIGGSGTYGYSGDSGPATLTQVDALGGVVKDSAGNVYLSDGDNHMVRMIAAGTGIITRIAGTGTSGYSGDGGPATSANLLSPGALALDSRGNLYVVDLGNSTVRQIHLATGIITTYAGDPSATASGDGGPASAASLGNIFGLALDATGNLYLTSNQSIREVTNATRIIDTIAGTGTPGYSGDGGPAINALFKGPAGLAFDGNGNLYIADSANNLIRKITATNGAITGSSIISTVAGDASALNMNPQGGYSGDGGPATSALLKSPHAVAVDQSSNLYIADYGNDRIRLVTASTGTITTFAGNGAHCVSPGGDGGSATDAALCAPVSIALDNADNILIADLQSNRLREVFTAANPPTTQAATPQLSLSGGTYSNPQTLSISDATPGASIYVTVDGTTPTTGAASGYSLPFSVTGAVTVKAIATAPGYATSGPASATYTITSFAPSITTVAGSGIEGFSGDGGPALNAEFGVPWSTAVDKTGNIYVSDLTNNAVWLISAQTGDASVVLGNPSTPAILNAPRGLALDSAGNLYIADSLNNRVLMVDAATGVTTTVAGPGNYALGSFGDGGAAIFAVLSNPQAVALDATGNLFIADSYHYVIRKVTAATGIITTVAGNGTDTFSGDGGPALNAGIHMPSSLALDRSGNIYVTDENYGRVRKITVATGIITTVAGSGDLRGNTGDGGPAASAMIYPRSLSTDASGNLYISSWPAQIRKVDANTGIITTVVGIGFSGFSGDGGAAQDAQIFGPFGTAFDPAGNLYFADSDNYRIRKVTLTEQATPTPTFSVAAGTYATTQSVSISDAAPGAVIYYTTDGTTPSTSSPLYSGPITVSSSQTINAIAVAVGYGPSAVASAAYVISVSAPQPSLSTLSPALTSAGGAAFTLTVNGAGFTSATTLYWGTTALTTTYVSATQLTAPITAANIASVGTAVITAQTPSPGGGTSNALSFEIDSAGSQTPPSFNPASVTASAGGSATYQVTLPSSATNVSVQCLNLPAGAACSYSSSTSTLTISTASTTPTGTYQITVVITETLPGAAAALLLLPLLMPRGKRKRARAWIVASSGLLFILLAAGSGCGGGSSGSGGGGSTTPPQTHQVTSAGTVTLVVK